MPQATANSATVKRLPEGVHRFKSFIGSSVSLRLLRFSAFWPSRAPRGAPPHDFQNRDDYKHAHRGPFHNRLRKKTHREVPLPPPLPQGLRPRNPHILSISPTAQSAAKS